MRPGYEGTTVIADDKPDLARGAIAIVLTLVMFFALLVGIYVGWKSLHRHQKLADARNEVRITEVQIRNQEQRVKIAQQQAQIRFENAKGVREAQDEIAKTLTPLYVQFEMVEALKEIARSGRNNSVVYLPSGANGIPLVSTVPGADRVTSPDDK